MESTGDSRQGKADFVSNQISKVIKLERKEKKSIDSANLTDKTRRPNEIDCCARVIAEQLSGGRFLSPRAAMTE